MADLSTLYEELEKRGIDKDRLSNCLDSHDNWGKMVHAFEYLAVLSVVEAMWPEGDL